LIRQIVETTSSSLAKTSSKVEQESFHASARGSMS
jgi:hypothetical protein